jgi:RNA polymerase sigma-70 factor, ECF subfamily
MVRVGSGDEISADVVEACRRGDRDALRTLYETYKDRVYSIAFHFFHGDAAAAADVTQQVFLKLMDGMAKYRGESAFSTWLYRVVRNACVDRSRRHRPEVAVPDRASLDAIADPIPAHDERFANGELAEAVQAAVASLPATLRFAILLRYFDELSYTEMAAALHCSIGTVSSRLSRGHRLLATKLAPLRGMSSDGTVKR